MPDIHLIPLAEIDSAALTRDRTGLDAEPQAELELSIAASGLRLPIEVFPIEPRGDLRYGLLTGYRRLLAFRALHERTSQDRYAAIPALIREATDLATALAAMVEENEIRADLSPFERGLIAVTARNQGAFTSIEEAVEKLYPNATKEKRYRLRTLAQVAEEMQAYLTAPEKLTHRQLVRIARAISGGFGELIRTALEESSITDPDHQWTLLQPVLAEAEEHAAKLDRPGPPPPHPPPPLRPHHPPRAHPRRLEPRLHRPRSHRRDD
jgi:ParB family chromosome partitioning protein